MAEILFDVAAFRLAFPAFTNPTTYTTGTLQAYWDTSTLVITNQIYGCSSLTIPVQTRALNLLTAHIAELSTQIAAGNAPGIITSAQIDKISVSLQPPPAKDQFQYWLNLTPYGQQLLMLLSVKASGGFYIGGLPETRAFRKFGGVF